MPRKHPWIWLIVITMAAGVVLRAVIFIAFFVYAYTRPLELPPELAQTAPSQKDFQGLKPEDRVVALDGIPTLDFTDLMVAGALGKPDENVEMEVDRPGVGRVRYKLTTGTISQTQPAVSPYAQWKNGPSQSADFFPLAVWLQDPRNAPKFKALGINTYVGLWQGPTEAQLAELRKNGIKVICELNDVAQKHLDDPTIIGWMHGDEPDNAQEIAHWKSIEQIHDAWPDAPQKTLKQWGGYGPPIPPKQIAADYQRIKRADPSRPVMLNLGQGVAFDKYVGRGYRSGHLEDYPQYIEGSDIVSFDIYPVVHDNPAAAGKLEYVPRGVERLVNWAGPQRVVWDCIECTHISNPSAIASPAQIRAEVWMSIIRGSKGLIYFVHEFKPKFIEAGLLAHDEQAKAVAAVNKEIQSLAAVINSPTREDAAKIFPGWNDPSVEAMVKKLDGATYVFVADVSGSEFPVDFQIASPGTTRVEVINENRMLPLQNGRFRDHFGPYEVHLYKIK